MQSRLAVIVVADVVGYSAMMADDQPATISAVKSINDNFLAPNATANSGEIVKRMGDGWIITFGSVPAAVKCAIETQSGLAEHPKIKLRIGAHIGEIVEDDDDFYGAGVNIAARLQSEAPPGGVMVSQDLQRQLTGDLGASFTDVGPFELKNIPYPVNGFQWRPKKKAVSTKIELPSIAVDDFQFAPTDSETEAAAHDLRDQILTNISARTGIRVIDDTGNGTAEPTYRVTARLRVAGTQGRLNLTMLQTDTGGTVFSKNYGGGTEDIFAFLDDVSGRADADIRYYTNAYDAERFSHIPDDELSLSELKARIAQLFYTGRMKNWERAGELVDRAIEPNPDDPMTLTMRANLLWIYSARWEEPPEETVAQCASDLNNAIARMPRSDVAYWCRSFFYAFAKQDAEAAMRDAKQAMSINPNHPLAHMAVGSAHMLAGNFPAAVEALNVSIDIGRDDSFSIERYFQLAVSHYCNGDFQAAVAAVDAGLQIDFGVWAFHRLKVLALRADGQHDAASKYEAVAAEIERGPSMATPKPPLPHEFDDLLAELAPYETG